MTAGLSKRLRAYDHRRYESMESVLSLQIHAGNDSACYVVFYYFNLITTLLAKPRIKGNLRRLKIDLLDEF